MTEQSTTVTTPAPQTSSAADAAATGTVPVGIATQAGYGVAIAGLVGAVAAYVTGDHSQAQLGAIVSGSIGVLSLVVTQIGRYVQANTQIKANRWALDAYHEAAGTVQVVEHTDPQITYQIAALVRAAVDERLKGLPEVPRAVVGDVEQDLLPSEQDLLPSEQEEAATQPPPGALSGGAAGSTQIGAGSLGSAGANGA
jgi:hypothetical protein